ncbi:hypothetical protein AB0I35_03875 [Nocardia sp. NPDC050378]|uniref:hypothetical protein n=1 Tax=Nocardia sp. NPDC050378 TaxID=3155400 RepID=UPI003402585A
MGVLAFLMTSCETGNDQIDAQSSRTLREPCNNMLKFFEDNFGDTNWVVEYGNASPDSVIDAYGTCNIEQFPSGGTAILAVSAVLPDKYDIPSSHDYSLYTPQAQYEEKVWLLHDADTTKIYTEVDGWRGHLVIFSSRIEPGADHMRYTITDELTKNATTTLIRLTGEL